MRIHNIWIAFAIMPLSSALNQAMEKTGAAEALAGALIAVGSKMGGEAVLIAIIYIVSVTGREVGWRPATSKEML